LLSRILCQYYIPYIIVVATRLPLNLRAIQLNMSGIYRHFNFCWSCVNKQVCKQNYLHDQLMKHNKIFNNAIARALDLSMVEFPPYWNSQGQWPCSSTILPCYYQYNNHGVTEWHCSYTIYILSKVFYNLRFCRI